MNDTQPGQGGPPAGEHIGTTARDEWTALRLFLGYRAALGSGLLLLYFVVARGPLGVTEPELFATVARIYAGIALLSLPPALLRVGQPQMQATVAMFLDILLITVMMHASGGVPSGLGMLIAISIALGSMCLAGRNALLFAALASLAVITERLYAHINHVFDQTAYTQAGMLGVSFFALAILTHRLSQRLRLSEQLASRRGQELANMAELNELVIRQMEAGILVVDDNAVVRLMNEAASRLLGLRGVRTPLALDAANADLDAQYRAWLETPMAELPPLRHGGRRREVKAIFNRLGESSPGTMIVLDDSTRTAARAQQMKLASLGRLTAGIAHEVRNPLGAISHAAQLLEESPQLPDADRRLLEIIAHNSQRVNRVIESILRLSRQQTGAGQTLDLPTWLREQAGDIRLHLGLAEQQVEIRAPRDPLPIRADPGQLRQILDTLCDNAVRHFDQPLENLRIILRGGLCGSPRHPCLECRDNGPGVPEEATAQLFEPFFTTRHQGTGLGLYIARQLSEANRARIEYHPLEDRGCSFRLHFANRIQSPA